jgi:hypothetical protein
MLEALWDRLRVTRRDLALTPEAIAAHRVSELKAHTRRGAAPVGMVQLGSMTYRILRLASTEYGVVRLLDDRYLGTFRTYPCLEIEPEEGVEPTRLKAIACAAIRAGRTSWVPPAARKAP